MRRSAWILLLAVIAVTASSCADYSIRRVPNRWERESNGGTWTDADQRDAEGMEGLRYYMARAHVVVHKPFPIDSETFVLNGQVSADGRFVRLQRPASAVSGDAWSKLERYVVGDGNAANLPTSLIGAPASAMRGDENQPSNAPRNPDVETPETPGGQGEGDTPAGEDSQEPTGGTSTLELRSDLSVQPTFPMRDFFDITYLPDYAEQYVIHGDANAGMLEMKLVWGPGNTLISMDATLDNSAIVGPLLSAYAGLVKQGGEFLRRSIIPGAQGAGDAESGGDTMATKATDLAASDVSIAIHVVRFAAPGVYPVMKPQEYFAAEQQRMNAAGDHLLIGRPPATTVSYKYYEVLIAECLSAQTPRAIGTIDAAIERAPRTAPDNVKAQGATEERTNDSATRGTISATSTERRAMKGALTAAGFAGLSINDATFDSQTGELRSVLVKDDPTSATPTDSVGMGTAMRDAFLAAHPGISIKTSTVDVR